VTIIVGVLHPGSMGAAIAARARRVGATVLWCPAGRSAATKQRAQDADLLAVESLTELVDRSDILICLCPPAHADVVTEQVPALGFTGIYVEANAISPTRTLRIAALLAGSGCTVVNASVIGSPPSTTKTTRLYLSGAESAVDAVAGLFAGTSVQALPLAGGVGKASALKLAYSSCQKASRVLAAVAHALATEHSVQDELLDVASLRPASYLTETEYTSKVAARAWRWGPEMLEVAQALQDAGLPDDLARATAAVLRCWDDSKDRTGLTMDTALERLRSAGPG
jgi:3-hydroxyisobutyrate dehydrogenase-like beta-hydroxyacid dehydrogenase